MLALVCASVLCRDAARLLRAWMCLVVDPEHLLHRKLGITLGRGKALMAEQLLNGTEVGALFKHVRAESVAQRMRVYIG